MDINTSQFRDELHKIPFMEDSWKDLISLVKETTQSEAGVMLITRDKDHDILTSHSPDFEITSEVRTAFEKSEWITAAMPEEWSKEYLNKGVVLGTDIISQKKMRMTPFYNDILRSLDLEYLMAGISLFGQDYRTLLKFFRNSKQGDYSNREALQLAALMPEIRQMMRFKERLYERMVIETAANRAGAPRGSAAIIIDQNGVIVHANEDAEKLLRDECLLKSTQKCLTAVHTPDNRAIKNMLDTALGRIGDIAQGCALIGEGSEAGIHQLLALPAPVEAPPFPWMETLKVAVVVIIDPMRKVKISASILKTMYRLTPAEINLVNAMANGIKPVQYAADKGKSVATVQSQRQAVFKKVSVKSQLELMRMLRDLTVSFEAITQNEKNSSLH